MNSQARDLRTSEVLRLAASWLDGAVEISRGALKYRDRGEMVALASELRVRASWIEVARADQGVSEDRRRGIAMIEDAEGRPEARRAILLRCTGNERCDFHRDGGPEAEKCPGVCDADGCTLDGEIEVAGERALCNAHAGLLLLAGSMRDALAADDAKGGR